jgi:hypothetical protein
VVMYPSFWRNVPSSPTSQQRSFRFLPFSKLLTLFVFLHPKSLLPGTLGNSFQGHARYTYHSP